MGNGLPFAFSLNISLSSSLRARYDLRYINSCQIRSQLLPVFFFFCFPFHSASVHSKEPFRAPLPGSPTSYKCIHTRPSPLPFHPPPTCSGPGCFCRDQSKPVQQPHVPCAHDCVPSSSIEVGGVLK
ncbi:hypothetical protein CAOG_009607 [Capsaspora owczarzaki ATCC 30864]|uniref:Uncharacterized protein n=1 Tax=Capsaspora owczarzaki (strain ATCC 30864) TaxID=595528 RepID=A0A0D2X241_CAPO3|nr:hypothetical protein CAOG_009607 [Capsaspora owczarzaki ATCC 30864]